MRQLLDTEISQLEAHGCRCADWSRVAVEDPFLPDRYRNVEFIGSVALGTTNISADPSTPFNILEINGVERQSGIYNSVIKDSRIGQNCYINGVSGGIQRVDIGNHCIIDNCYFVGCTAESSFGNGVVADVMSETGGRSVKLHEQMSAQMAYMQVFYRHNALFSRKMMEISTAFAESLKSERMTIGDGARLLNCGTIDNVRILHACRLYGVSRLKNGTASAAIVGENVIAEDFIFQRGCQVTDGANIHRSLIGECCHISAATIHDSLIFSNSTIENGEVAASFLGPFSTTMHKSTLLIGGLFSFFNAGSGSNQSNHMYKLGPMHQGVTLRGCKTGSDSYILWPAAIGAFTTILGRHYSHPDTRRFPFSVLTADPATGESILLPGAAAATVGLARDVEKWPNRDARDTSPAFLGSAPLDIINYKWLSPFTAVAILQGLAAIEENGDVSTNGVMLKGLEKGKKLYKLLLTIFAAGVIARKMRNAISTNPEADMAAILEMLRRQPGEEGKGAWVDMAGMLLPKGMADDLMQQVSTSADIDLNSFQQLLEGINKQYFTLSYQWVWHNLEALIGEGGASLSTATLKQLLTEGAAGAENLEQLWRKDAVKEFDVDNPVCSLGFGIDAYGEKNVIADDFQRSRGSLEGQRFLAQLHQRVSAFTAQLRAYASPL